MLACEHDIRSMIPQMGKLGMRSKSKITPPYSHMYFSVHWVLYGLFWGTKANKCLKSCLCSFHFSAFILFHWFCIWGSRSTLPHFFQTCFPNSSIVPSLCCLPFWLPPSVLSHFHSIPSELFPFPQALSSSLPPHTIPSAVFFYAYHFHLFFPLFPGLSLPQTFSPCLSDP